MSLVKGASSGAPLLCLRMGGGGTPLTSPVADCLERAPARDAWRGAQKSSQILWIHESRLISAAGAVDREFYSGFFGFFEFFCWIWGSRRCPSGEISKFWSRWSPGEPEMILKCPDQAPGQLRVFEEFKFFCKSRPHMPPHAKLPLRK